MYSRMKRLMSSRYGVSRAMRRAPSASKAANAAVIGVVHATPGRAARIRANTCSSPITIEADVQPKATTSSGRPGRITSAASVRRASIALSVAGVIAASFRMRLS